MSKILIDDKEYAVNPQHNLLQVILSLGLDLPYFCWHPALGSVGSCRQCAVTQYMDDNDSRGRLVVACMTPIQDGMRIGLHEAQASAFRASVIETLMTNHPHDCPVCEEGGECHLQDMTEMSGHILRRYRGLKRTHRNQYLGPFINHEMNRCIACYRCVRFYQDYAGGQDLSAQAAHNHVYFGREQDGVLDSPFSGNLVEVCPTGVFTDRTYSRHYSRKWDLQCAPSVCAHCAVGCNTTPAQRYDRILRITNRYQHQLNGYFLCDRGRFGYDYSNAPERLRQGYRRSATGTEGTDAGVLLAGLIERIRDPAQAVFAIGSPRASLENNFALSTLVGPEHFFAGIAAGELQCLRRYLRIAARRDTGFATLRDIEQADAALIIGEDIAATAPRVALSLRQLVRNRSLARAREQKIAPWQDAAVRNLGHGQRSPLWQLVPGGTALDDITERLFCVPVDDIARLTRALARHLAGDATEAITDPQQRAWVEDAAAMLCQARQPLLLAGCGIAAPDPLDALAELEQALRDRGHEPLLYVGAMESNSVGLAALAQQGFDELRVAMEQARAQGKARSLVILENDLQRRLAPEALARLRRLADHWLVLDSLDTDTVQRADALVPVPTQFEQQGTLVNASGMAQRFQAVQSTECAPPWQQLARAVIRQLNGAEQSPDARWALLARWHSSDAVRHSLAAAVPIFADIERAGPAADMPARGGRLQRQSARYSGRTAMHAHQQVREFPPPADADSPYSFSMEGVPGPGAARASVWAPGWNSGQALNRFQQEVGADWRDAPALVRLDFRALDQPQFVPAPVMAGTPQWQLIPRYEVFAAEELSGYAPAVAERAGPAVLGIDSQSARRLNVTSWDSLELHYGGCSQTLYVQVEKSLPADSLAIPQRPGFWRAGTDQSPALSLRPAAQPLPPPVRLIASDREGDRGGDHG
ncbi:NADH dehydrogenase (quinone) subunit G [Marinobacterium aestuarii]|uniref:NADH-quinone oxidoreductase subunit G n=1 Tax=Marinobacterium aestuarii TaxID=1821621 RepID=A0A1A9EU75_9GAMM|nr:NADH-quinone oxidoreductase subunit NuoG [Marinobacterium aestuarii]ANG61290.1 NADH dehydrogenase (quinone) subunit G [Marinobacterium aestuarii]